MAEKPSVDLHGLAAFIDQAQDKVGMSDKDLAEALGFSRTDILTHIKSGAMKMPVGKVPLIATTLEVSASDVLTVLLEDYYSGELLQVMRKTWGVLNLSPDERKLIATYRAFEGEGSEPRVVDGKNIIAVVMV